MVISGIKCLIVKLIILVLIAGTVQSVKAVQEPIDVFSYTFGYARYQSAQSIQETIDGSYIVVGTTYISSLRTATGIEPAIWVIKFESEGREIWNKTYNMGIEEGGISISKTFDGDYIILATVDSRIFAIKIDPYGDVIWQNSYGGYSYNIPSNIIQTVPDNGYAIIGSNTYFSFLIKLDSLGNEIWRKTLGEESPQYNHITLTSILQTEDNGYIMSGQKHNINIPVPNSDGILVRTDPQGNILWQKVFDGDMQTYDTANCDELLALDKTSDNGFILAGWAAIVNTVNPSISKCVNILIKTDGEGDEQWRQLYNDHSGRIYTVRQTIDGGYFMSGMTQDGPTYHASVIKTDSLGTMSWNRTLWNNSQLSIAYSSINTMDNSYVTVGIVLNDIQYAFITKLGYSIPPITDVTPPTTVISRMGDNRTGDWFVSPVNINFTATDDQSGVNRTEYRLSTSGPWTTYIDDFAISTEGDTPIQYRSIDNAGNIESINSSLIRIDTIFPIITITGVTNGATYDTNVTPIIAVTDINLVYQSTTLNEVPYISGTAIYNDGNYWLNTTAVDIVQHVSKQNVSFAINKATVRRGNGTKPVGIAVKYIITSKK